MTVWAERLVGELDAADERARNLAGQLSAEQLNWQPAPEAWSVGQCLEHLCNTNDVYLLPISKALEGKPKKAVEEITPGWFGRFFLQNFIEPGPKTKKAPAPKKIVPGSRVELSVLQRFMDGNRAMRELIGRASDYDVNGIRFANPFIPLIRFTVGTGLQIVTRHQVRHLLQAERVRGTESFPR